MHSASLLLLLGALAAASPLASPQEIDIGAIIAAGPPPSISYATVPTVIKINPTALASEAAAAITASPLTSQPATSLLPSSVVPLGKRQVTSATFACSIAAPLPTGAGFFPTSDTPSAFLADPYISSVASVAPTPLGYVNSFTNLQAENQAYSYLGYSLLQSYDTVGCASQCNAIYGCMAINVLFERDPSVDPESGCDDPPSTTLIKCVFWGAPVTAENAINSGQYRDNFEVVIAGSNGYVNKSYPAVSGYTGPDVLGNASINAPLDCNGGYTYMGYVSWNDGKPFDPSRCAAACTAQSNYNVANPPASGRPMTCQFFNTYFLLENGQVQAQVCAMYNETWNATYAVNTGYYYGSDVYTIESSVAYSNTTAPGVCTPALTNLVPNGDFSQGYNKDWSVSTSKGTYSAQNAQSSYDSNGAVSLSCGSPYGGSGSVTYKSSTFALVTGSVYTLSFRYYYVPGENGGVGGTTADVVVDTSTTLNAPAANGWALASTTFTAQYSTTSVNINLACPLLNELVIYFDEFLVEAAA